MIATSFDTITLLLVALFVSLPSLVDAAICPLTSHQVCNDEAKQLRCVCAMSLMSEEEPPEQSCTNLINVRNLNDFEAVSIIFDLSSTRLDAFPEAKFRDQIASYVKADTQGVLVVRMHCLDTTKIAIQFVVVKNEDGDDDNDGIADSMDTEDSRVPYGQAHFVRASDLVNRLKVGGPMSSIAGLRVESIDYVGTLYPIEADADNSVLIMQAAIVAIFVTLTCLCGCWVACRKKSDYDGELQK